MHPSRLCLSRLLRRACVRPAQARTAKLLCNKEGGEADDAGKFEGSELLIACCVYLVLALHSLHPCRAISVYKVSYVQGLHSWGCGTHEPSTAITWLTTRSAMENLEGSGTRNGVGADMMVKPSQSHYLRKPTIEVCGDLLWCQKKLVAKEIRNCLVPGSPPALPQAPWALAGAHYLFLSSLERGLLAERLFGIHI
uniref:Uncharacterized protein n=1 Tax=Melopsittacus undulatus TaxID=13146 RepID=A0A8V5H868_MELUD